MNDKTISGKAAPRRTEDEQRNPSGADSDSSAVGLLVAAARLYPVPRPCAGALIVAGVALGGAGDALLHDGGPPGLNLSLWIALVAIAGLIVHHRAGLALDRRRAAWLATGVIFAAGLAWRDAPPLKLLALG